MDTRYAQKKHPIHKARKVVKCEGILRKSDIYALFDDRKKRRAILSPLLERSPPHLNFSDSH
ncbi:hypothetical protein D0911_02690 [Zhongshania marina]|uniref:Transposase n=1 Tax=Zhongshania marina TaxID=2304603 RepID=A0ABX9W677_9GAMM|nr:hypothetical protein D0911_02690 [Zhongshania marina]